MTASWYTLCGHARQQREGDEVVVTFEGGRRHRVAIVETNETYEITAIVARAAALAGMDDLPQRIWERNRASRLVGFRFDPRGRLCAIGWLPRAGITTAEFQRVIHRVAAESDRMEFLLTGADAE